MLFSIILVALTVSLCSLRTLADDEYCAKDARESLVIKNCCDLKQRSLDEFAFSEITGITYMPEVYKLKNFCNKNCSTVVIKGFCDTLTDGGGWLVVQRRTNGSENFQRRWSDYEKGFGSLRGELCRAGGMSSQLVRPNLTMRTMQINAWVSENFMNIEILFLPLIL